MANNILICASGLTPQIVTETLFALSVQKGIRVDEIYIITTKRGKTVLEGKDKSKTTPSVSLVSQIKELCAKYNLTVPKFNIRNNVVVAEEESLKLFDVKTDKDNVLFPNKAAKLIRNLTEKPNCIIHASLSGGRKSMSAHLALVLSIFARSGDKLYHVLTDEKFEFKNFYPKTDEEAKALIIAEIPFVKLRSLNHPLLKKESNYSAIIEKTQERLKFLTDESKLVIELKPRKIRYKSESIILTPTETAVYTLFAERKIQAGGGLKNSDIQTLEFAIKLKDIVENYFNYFIDGKDKNNWFNKGLSAEYFLSVKSKINGKLKNLFREPDLYDEFCLHTRREWGNSTYLIKAPKEKLGINYD